MKSQANGLLMVAEAVLKDYALAYPDDKMDIARDKERLTRLTKERGKGLFLLDLPALDGFLTKSLETCRLIVEGALSKKASATIQVPRLFRGLWLRIFDRHGNLMEDADPTALLFLRQLLCLGKKVEVECSTARTKTALKEYYHVEQISRLPTFSWGNDVLGSDDSCSFDDLCDHHSDSGGNIQLELWHCATAREGELPSSTILRRLQRNFDAFSQAIGTFGIEDFLSSIRANSNGIGFRHGPGAVSDQTRKAYKYDFPTWSEKLGAIFPFRDFGTVRNKVHDRNRARSSSDRDPSFWRFEPLGSISTGKTDCTTMVHTLPFPQGWESWDISGLLPESPLHTKGNGFDPLGRATPLGASPSVHEPPSRLLAVPKTAKGPRLIAAEPTAHQWCQQFIKRFLEERLTGLFGTNFVSFRNQDLSKVLVSKASLDKSLATVDLSSASDRLTCWVVERAFRANQPLLHALHATRTRWVKDEVDKTSPPNFLVSRKFASQGTAVTFPVQSIIFLIIALTACGFEAKGPEDFLCNGRICNSVGRFRNEVRVFGDDIIIPVHGYVLLCKLLHALGLKVNVDKSFVNGNFRESCGMDCFKGVNVTPIKTTCIDATGPSSRQSLLDYANNLHRAGFWKAAETVESMLPGWVLANTPVCGFEDGGAGRFSFLGGTRDHLRKRWNRNLHRFEYRQYSQIGSVRRTPVNTLSGVLQYFAEAPSPLEKWEHGIQGVPRTSDGLRWRAPYALSKNIDKGLRVHTDLRLIG